MGVTRINHRFAGWLAAFGAACLGLGGCDPGKPLASPAPGGDLQPPAPANAPAPLQDSILRSGRFVDGEHPTQGEARVVKRNQQRILELDSTFSTSTSGPDLVVIVHRSNDVIGSSRPPAFPIDEDDYVILAPLKDYRGAQSYRIPDQIDLDDYPSVAIWCRRFNATFGAAALKP